MANSSRILGVRINPDPYEKEVIIHSPGGHGEFLAHLRGQDKS
jgi:hypothetical protein